MENGSDLKIAVVGGGVAGIVSAHLLQRRHRVTLIDRNDYLGGHTHTIEVDEGLNGKVPVDTGFIVLNDRTYPHFSDFLDQLEVRRTPTDMALSYHCGETGFCYAGTDLNGLFAQRSRIFSPSHWRFLTRVLSFGLKTLKNLKSGSLRGQTLGEYLAREKVPQEVVERYIVPMASAIWSTPHEDIFKYPMETFARFYDNHGLLSFTQRPEWYFIEGGSHTYVKAFRRNFRGQLRLHTPVVQIRRFPHGVELKFSDGFQELYDRVVIATHADEALQLLEDPSPEEQVLLSPWRYTPNRVLLHSDVSVLPPFPRAWAAWNCFRSREGPSHTGISVSYYMNRLQKLRTSRHYCVSLNLEREVPREHVIERFLYTHPMYTFESIGTQEGLSRLNGDRNTYFCGSYFGYGFHEDAVRSAVQMGRLFGLEL